MKKLKKKGILNKGLIILLIIFLILFFIKASFYGLFGDTFFVDNFSRNYLVFYTFIFIYYVFMLPIIIISGIFNLLNSNTSLFTTFLFDITITILYLTVLYFIFKKIIYFFKKRKKSI